MKIGARELRKIRGSLILLALVSAVGAASVFFVNQQKQQATAAVAQARSLRAQAEMRLNQVSNEEQEIKAKTALFRKMQERGMIGEERRLEWVELIREQRDRHRLFEIDYEISPQQKLGDAAVGGYQFRSSLLTLRAPLLHEEDLLRLLDGLQQNAQALVVPRHCALNRQKTGSDRSSLAAQLHAECALQWITLREPRQPGETP